MNYVRLNDLDELILRVRDPKTKPYIAEAVNAYRGGAYRAAIISTWIAVAFDIISKIRELALQGDSCANKLVTELDKAISANEKDEHTIKQGQEIESNLLNYAFKFKDSVKCSVKCSFEFLSFQEYEDLVLLKKDRNLCAHPAFVAEESLFEPEPERVRMHIVHAVNHLLQHQPVQGNSALERLKADLNSITFPNELESVSVFLNTKYLDRAKDSLIKSLIDALVKALLEENIPNLPASISDRILLSLQSIAKKHIVVYEKYMEEKLPKIVETLKDKYFPNIFQLIGIDERCWGWIGESSRIRIKTMTENVLHGKISEDTDTIAILQSAINITELESLILSQYDSLELKNKIEVIGSIPRPEFAKDAIEILSNASNWVDTKKSYRSVISPMAQHFSAGQVIRILKILGDNSQIHHAIGLRPLLLKTFFRETTQHLPVTQNAWKELCESCSRSNISLTYIIEQLEERNISVSQPLEDQ
jgi:hypothetical protein